jgi:CRISPR-associated endonuclease/helicase Cas3
MGSSVALSSIPVPESRALWAKSTGETIAAHTLRVLENLRQLRRRSPQLGDLAGMPHFWRCAALAACVHDLGKCSAGFQKMLRGGERYPHRHEVLSAVFLPWVIGNESPRELAWAGAAILTHHKNWDEIERLYPPLDPFLDTPDGLEQLNKDMSVEFFVSAERIAREDIWPELLAKWSVPEAYTANLARDWIPDQPVMALRSVLQAVGNLLRKIGEQSVPSPEVVAGTLLRGALILADHSGSAKESFSFLEVLKDVDRTRACLDLADNARLYEHQRRLAACPGNTVLSAPTGSGKTEAALLWAARQNGETAGYPVLYYLLPYQASLNAMRQRLAGYFGDASLTLHHSRAVQSLYRQLLDKEYSPLEAQRIVKREKNLASLQVRPVRITTPYQLLKGAFQLKGHEALWTAAASALFVLDEVHVYETVRLGILLATLRYLCRDLGGHALVMSATLPSYLWHVLADSLPCIAQVATDERTLQQFSRHEVRLVAAELTDDSVVEEILASANHGMAVLTVTTTVGRAQALWRKLQAKGASDIEILHGRFHAEDRARKERDLLARVGVGRPSGEGGVILVATQVVEVSLNLDFDILFSDPAPLEALLQRFGRVNRARSVPTRIVAVCGVVPEGCPVYPELLINKALTVLGQWHGKAIDERDVQSMLDQIYAGGTGDQATAEIRNSMDRFTSRVLATCRPFASDERIADLFDEMFDGYEVLPSCLEEEYRRRMENDPLLAPGLLVPITCGQYFNLHKRGLLRRVDSTIIAECPYTDQGLEVHGPPREDGV